MIQKLSRYVLSRNTRKTAPQPHKQLILPKFFKGSPRDTLPLGVKGQQEKERKMQLLQTYLHSPGLSQNPCCSSHPGKQMAAGGKGTGSSPPESFQHEGATSCAQRAREPAGPGIGLYSARGAFFLTQQLKDKRARKPPPPQAPFLLREGQKSFPLLLPHFPILCTKLHLLIPRKCVCR